MELQAGDLVQHLAGIPDYGAGIVIEQYVSVRLGNRPRVKVLWQKPQGYIVWVGNHQLEKISVEGDPEKSE